MEDNHFDDNSTWGECNLKLDTNVRRVMLFLLYLLIFMAGLVENLLVLWVNWRHRRSANGVLFCILNMSFSDLMLVVTLPFFMMEVTVDHVWLWGSFLCRMTNLIFTVNVYSSSFFLALMTLERYLSLTKPDFPALFPVVGRRRWWLCGGVWLFSFFLALLENVHFQLMENKDPGCHWYPERDFLEWAMCISFIHIIFQFLVPAAVIITCNVLIARAVRATPDVQNPRDVWLVHVYTLVFVLCWLPHHLQMLINTIDYINIDKIIYSCNFSHLLNFLYEVMKVLSLFHCVANPILYNFLGKSFRSKLIDTVVTCINKEGNGPHGRAGTGPGEGQGKVSNASTSQSAIGS